MIFNVAEQDFEAFYNEVTTQMKTYLADIVDFIRSILSDYFSDNTITVFLGAAFCFIVLTIVLKAINHR